MPASTPASSRFLFAACTLVALQGCGSCVGEQKSDPAPAQPAATTPSKLPPVSGDKAVPLDNVPRSYLDAATTK
ncbi:hypothetical protein BH11MYX4_BH11MYX4_65830 [soil metagenome]